MKPASEILASFPAPPEPTEKCSECGEPAMRPGVCYECKDRKRKVQEAIRETRLAMPPRYMWALGLDASELASRVDPEGLRQLRAHFQETHRIDRVTFLGPAGSGKTSLAVATANQWSVAWASSAGFAAAVDLGVARQQHGLGQGEAMAVRDALRVSLLVLDDLGQEADLGVPVITHVVHARYDDAKPTIVTTGLSVEQLVRRYGTGTARRLIETDGGAMVLKLKSRKGRAEGAER